MEDQADAVLPTENSTGHLSPSGTRLEDDSCASRGRRGEVDLKEVLTALTSLPHPINNVGDIQLLENLVKSVLEVLPGPFTPQKFCGIDSLRHKIDPMTYNLILQSLISTFCNDWNAHMLPTLIHATFTVNSDALLFFESLSVLSNFVKDSEGPSIKLEFVVRILKSLIEGDAFFCVLLLLCVKDNEGSSSESNVEMLIDSIIQCVAALPNRVANKLQLNTPEFFLPQFFGKVLCCQVAKSVEFLSCAHKYKADFNVLPLACLLGKLTILVQGTETTGISYLSVIFEHWSVDNAFASVIQSMFSNINRPYIEKMAVTVLTVCKGPKSVDRILGGAVHKSKDWKYIMCTKIPLLSYYNWKDPLLLHNLVGYLSLATCAHAAPCTACSAELMKDLTMRLLNVWGSRSALNHTPLQQHIYVTQALLLCVNELKNFKDGIPSSDKMTIQSKLFSSVPLHLESPLETMRAVGMVTVEMANAILYTENEKDKPPLTLNFDFSGMSQETLDIVSNLRQLLNIHEKETGESKEETGKENNVDKGNKLLEDYIIECIPKQTNTSANKLNFEMNSEVKLSELRKKRLKDLTVKTEEIEREIKKMKEQDSSSEMDSDDEDEDDCDDCVERDQTDLSGVNRPKYLRDLQEGLIETKDPKKFAECMKICKQLVLSQLPNDEESLGIELIDILVTLDERFYTKDFEAIKLSSLIAVVTVYPSVCAEHICSLFNKAFGKYSISQKALMLDVLIGAAKELSNPSDSTVALPVKENLSSASPALSVVQARIESNTRRFFSVPRNKLTSHKNRFSQVAGSFFFPLLQEFGRARGGLWYEARNSFADSNNVLLVHLLRTLDVVMFSAANSPLAPRMGRELLNVVWSLRYHEEAKVRIGLMCCVGSVVMSVSKAVLQSDFHDSLLEISLWLRDSASTVVGKGDPDVSCRELAAHVLVLITSVFQDEIKED